MTASRNSNNLVFQEKLKHPGMTMATQTGRYCKPDMSTHILIEGETQIYY